MNPLVSVVIPVYNGSNYLQEAINSALAQTYNNIEILVIDDGSTDDTWEIIKTYGDRIRRFHKENGGVTTALNLGIQMMNGEWFTWLSHDDLWEPTFIEKQIQNIHHHPKCMISYTGFYNIDSNGNILSKSYPRWYPRGKATRIMIVHGSYIYGITVLVNKKCFEEIGTFDNKWRYLQDTDMWFRLVQNYETCCIFELLAIRRVHENQTGVKSKDDFETETKIFFRYWDNKYSLYDYFPDLNSKKMTIIKRNIIVILGTIFMKYTSYCHKHDLPITPIQGIWHLIPKAMKNRVFSYYTLFIRNLSMLKYK